jgi:hypothetical protein
MREPLFQRAFLLHQNPVVAPDMQLRQVPARQTKQLSEHAQRQRPGEGADHVDFARGRQRREQFVDDAPDGGLERSDPPRRETLGHEAADTIVLRWIDFDNVGHLAKTFRENCSDFLGHRRRVRFQRARRGKRLVILEHGQNIVVARHNPELERRHIKDRLFAAGDGQNVEGIFPLLGRERIEGHCERRRGHRKSARTILGSAPNTSSPLRNGSCSFAEKPPAFPTLPQGERLRLTQRIARA